MDSEVPGSRVRTIHPGQGNQGPVVYWASTARRTGSNAGFQYAAEQAAHRGVGMWMLEILPASTPYASERFHHFIQQGMRDNEDACRALGIGYHAHIPEQGNPTTDLIAQVTRDAGLVVVDDHPLPAMKRQLALLRGECRIDAVDGNGLMPMSAVPKQYSAAVHFRRHLQKTLPDHWWFPELQATCDGADVPEPIMARWPHNPDVDPATRAIDHTVKAVELVGGSDAAREHFAGFDVTSYSEARHPDKHATSGMSPYLHFGHAGTHQMVKQLLDDEEWNPSRSGTANGARNGWWGVSEPLESFLDQIITWRELGFADCHHRPDNHTYGSLPEWSRQTLETHVHDDRHLLDDETLEHAETDDPVWNAAQRELLRDGVIHNYLRMLWGKRIIEWSRTPQQALERMLHLNDKWALDGRDPNSISGIAWVMGRFDRAWGERSVYGKVRYMSSSNTQHKLRMAGYLARFGPSDDAQ